MNKGKRAKKREHKSINIKICLAFIVTLVIGVVAYFAYININRIGTNSVIITDPTIKIYYINSEDEAIEIKEGEVLTKHVAIMSNKGTINIKRKEDSEFREYNKEVLKDGIYLVETKTEEGLTQKNFTIDTLPPKVSGVENNEIYTTPQKIIFENIKDVGLATLTRRDGTVVDLKAKGKKEYTVKEEGIYVLRVEDKYGNAIIPILFKIENPSN